MIKMTVVSNLDPALLAVASVRKSIERQLPIEGKRYLELYEATVSAWKTKPQFRMETDITANEAWVAIGTDNDIYRFLHDGTKTRWAVMSPDWQSKTVPRILGNAPGAGVVVLRGKRTMKAPQPGIQAREWTQEIILRDKDKFQKNMEAAITNGLPKDAQP